MTRDFSIAYRANNLVDVLMRKQAGVIGYRLLAAAQFDGTFVQLFETPPARSFLDPAVDRRRLHTMPGAKHVRAVFDPDSFGTGDDVDAGLLDTQQFWVRFQPVTSGGDGEESDPVLVLTPSQHNGSEIISITGEAPVGADVSESLHLGLPRSVGGLTIQNTDGANPLFVAFVEGGTEVEITAGTTRTFFEEGVVSDLYVRSTGGAVAFSADFSVPDYAGGYLFESGGGGGGGGGGGDVPTLAQVLAEGNNAGGLSITGVGTLSGTNVTASSTVSAATGNITTVNSTTVNAADVIASDDVSAADLIASATISGPVANITTVNATDVVATDDVSAADLIASATVSGPVGNITTVNSTTVNAADVIASDDVSAADLIASATISGPVGNITTVNATDVIASDDVSAADLIASATISGPVGNITTVNATDVIASDDVSAADLIASATVSGPVGNITTVNSTTVNAADVIASDDVSAADLIASATISGPVGNITTVNATTVAASGFVNAANLSASVAGQGHYFLFGASSAPATGTVTTSGGTLVETVALDEGFGYNLTVAISGRQATTNYILSYVGRATAYRQTGGSAVLVTDSATTVQKILVNATTGATQSSTDIVVTLDVNSNNFRVTLTNNNATNSLAINEAGIVVGYHRFELDP